MKQITFPQYFKTKEGLLCHTVSELCHLNENLVIGLPKYFPLDHQIENCRIISGKPYTDHLATFQDSLDRTRNLYFQYMKYIPFFGEELCVFDINKDIVEIFDPLKTARSIYKNEKNKYEDQIIKDTIELINISKKLLHISVENIGIEGSIMLNCFRKTSDIDGIIYGEKNVNNLINNFSNLKKDKKIHLYDMSDIDLIFSRRYKYRSFNSNEELLLQEKKRTVGLINNRRFWLQPILGSNRLEKDHLNRVISKIDIIEDIFIVINSEYGHFWPAFYTLFNKKFGTICLECYDPIYMNQLKTGDTTLVRGNLYLNSNNNKKIIIMGPWITTTQFIKLI